MIKQLNQKEIEDITEKIETLKNDDFYKYYFDESGEEKKADRAFLIDNKYYVDFTIYSNICFMGVIDINRDLKTSSVYELLKLLNEQLKHYKSIAQWCYKKNEIAYRFHNFLEKKYNCIRTQYEEKSIIGVML